MQKLETFITILFIIGISFIISYINTFLYYPDVFNEIKGCCEMSINTNFFVVLVGLYGAVIAFFVPLSIEMVSKIGKMYETEVVAEMFKNEKEVKYIHIHLLIGIVTSAFLLALNDVLDIKIVLLLTFFIAFHFLYIIRDIYKFILLLKFYTDTDSVLERLQGVIHNAIDE